MNRQEFFVAIEKVMGVPRREFVQPHVEDTESVSNNEHTQSKVAYGGEKVVAFERKEMVVHIGEDDSLFIGEPSMFTYPEDFGSFTEYLNLIERALERSVREFERLKDRLDVAMIAIKNSIHMPVRYEECSEDQLPAVRIMLCSDWHVVLATVQIRNIHEIGISYGGAESEWCSNVENLLIVPELEISTHGIYVFEVVNGVVIADSALLRIIGNRRTTSFVRNLVITKNCETLKVVSALDYYKKLLATERRQFVEFFTC